jgi:oligopeptide transport system ATP-binding protein
MTKLLDVRGLETHFKARGYTVHAVNGVSFSVEEGETLAIVGESGCGKSVSVMSVLQLIPTPPGKVVAGEAYFEGKDLLKMSDAEIRWVRGAQISMVFQDPMTSFNPVLTIRQQVVEPLQIHADLSAEEATARVTEMLELVRIPNAKDRLDDYPYQFSGGMRQRAMIAMALVCNPKLMIADEPTTALDVTVQAQIIELAKQLRDEMGMATIWITHDLGVVAGLADRVSVMYAGFIIEEAPVEALYASPQHPYTIGLMDSLPRMDELDHRRLSSIDGMPPVLVSKPDYCPFLRRCNHAVERCRAENPPLVDLGGGHRVACWVNPDTGEER